MQFIRGMFIEFYYYKMIKYIYYIKLIRVINKPNLYIFIKLFKIISILLKILSKVSHDFLFNFLICLKDVIY